MLENEKKYQTLTDLLEMSGREAMPIVARVAPAIERVARDSGVVSLLFSDAFIKATSGEKMTKAEREQNAVEMRKIGEEMLLRVLRYGLGDNLADMEEIVSALNGITVDELLDSYTTKEIIEMVKAIITDKGFLSSLRTLTD